MVKNYFNGNLADAITLVALNIDCRIANADITRSVVVVCVLLIHFCFNVRLFLQVCFICFIVRLF